MITCLFVEKTFVSLQPVKALIEVPDGEPEVDLAVLVDSYPEPNMTWYMHSEPINVFDRHYEVR